MAYVCRFWAAIALLLMIVLLQESSGEESEIAFSDAPEGVAWAVQISDIHVSVFHPDRAEELETLASRFLKLVQPAIVLVTGDLTDAKNKDLSVTRQDEAEWIQYRNSMKLVAERSGLPQHVFFDLRGNHDSFGVPQVNSELDFFSRYSISAAMNRKDRVQSATVTVPGGWKYLFLGFDDTMGVGLRGPTNLFGHPTDSMLSTLDSFLERFGRQSPDDRSAKILFGHFPMSFTASSETGKRPEEIFARRGVSAYVCGHLHTKFGKQLYKLHSHKTDVVAPSKAREFWEWEMGDWRGSRVMRLISIDHGHTSFVDTRLNVKLSNNSTVIVLPTYPLDSRFMKKNPAYVGYDEDHSDSIRALVFSKDPVSSVAARIYDTKHSPPQLVDTLEMQPVSEVYYKTAWRRNRYSDPSPLRYWLEISTVDDYGRASVSESRPFSVDGRVAAEGVKWGISGFLVMGVQWANAYVVLFWLIIGLILGVELVSARLACLYLERRKSYNRSSVMAKDDALSLRGLLWVFMEGSRAAGLWWSQVALVLGLLFLPWFWGNPLGDGEASGYMTRGGWQIQGDVSAAASAVDLGAPDNMVVVLPFLYMVVFPLTVLIACMSAERAAYQVHHCEARKKQRSSTAAGAAGAAAPRKKKLSEKPDSGGLLQLLDKEAEQCLVEKKRVQCSGCSRWTRKALYAGFAVVGWLHWRQCHWLAAAFGFKVLASPCFAWSVPLLMALAAYETSS